MRKFWHDTDVVDNSCGGWIAFELVHPLMVVHNMGCGASLSGHTAVGNGRVKPVTVRITRTLEAGNCRPSE